jgi:signal transduction histidine kinase
LLARAFADTRAQLAVERTAREQAEKLATLGKMATGLAHEINNPVAAIKLHAQLLEGDCPSTPESRLGIILAEAAKIESLVSQWMFLARPQPPQVVECDFSEILTDSIRSHTPAAQHARVKISNEVPPGCVIRADRRRLAQAIANILTNAIHAMSAKGGTLGIRHPAGQSVSGSNGGKALHPRPSIFTFTFTDTGPGFSSSALARAPELFFSEKEGT